MLLAGISSMVITACAPRAPNNEAISPVNAGSVQTYDGTAYRYPIRAKYPASMVVDGGCMGEGCGFSFTFTPRGNAMDNARVHVFLPAGTASAAELEGSVTGADGLIDRAGWTISSIRSEGSEDFPYDWVKTVISFSDTGGQAGYVLLGEISDQAVQVLMKYPVGRAQAYRSDAGIILESLEFEEEWFP